MKEITFEKLYDKEFVIYDVIAKPQYWANRGNIYNCLGTPKISHTLLWFKNCGGVITDKDGNVLNVCKNQMVYTAKGTEYHIEFLGTNEKKEDTYVFHFQMTDKHFEDIIPVKKPIICIKNVDVLMGEAIVKSADEFNKNIICKSEICAVIYNILSIVCKKQRRHNIKKRYACILSGIELLEENSNLKIDEIAKTTGVSSCYFRKLFEEYSGESPILFRQRHRIEKAKLLLLSEEDYSIGEISQMLGFSDIYHFSKSFKKFTSLSPSEYKKNNENGKHIS